MNNIETLSALVELNPEADTLADMLTDALIDEADQLPEEARKKVATMRQTVLDTRYLQRAAFLMSMNAKSRNRALALISCAVKMPVRFRMVVLVVGAEPPTRRGGIPFAAGWDGIMPECITVGAEWLLNNSTAADRLKAIECHAHWSANNTPRR